MPKANMLHKNGILAFLGNVNDEFPPGLCQ